MTETDQQEVCCIPALHTGRALRSTPHLLAYLKNRGIARATDAVEFGTVATLPTTHTPTDARAYLSAAWRWAGLNVDM